MNYLRYVQISGKGNYGNFRNFQEHINSKKSIFENFGAYRNFRKYGNFRNYRIFRSNRACGSITSKISEISVISFFGSLNTAGYNLLYLLAISCGKIKIPQKNDLFQQKNDLASYYNGRVDKEIR
jgi:hypothetical protein